MIGSELARFANDDAALVGDDTATGTQLSSALSLALCCLRTPSWRS